MDNYKEVLSQLSGWACIHLIKRPAYTIPVSKPHSKTCEFNSNIYILSLVVVLMNILSAKFLNSLTDSSWFSGMLAKAGSEKGSKMGTESILAYLLTKEESQVGARIGLNTVRPTYSRPPLQHARNDIHPRPKLLQVFIIFIWLDEFLEFARFVYLEIATSSLYTRHL